jgi:hypothetical protein
MIDVGTRYLQVVGPAYDSAHIPPGRDGLFSLVRSLPETLRYENHLILAEGDYVICHGRFSGHGRPRSWVAADIVRSRSFHKLSLMRIRNSAPTHQGNV